MIVIGLAGSTACGKDTVADFLKKEGFEKMALSDMLRKLAKENNMPIDAENLFKLSFKYKDELGEGFLGKMALAEFRKKGWDKVCVVGLRRFGEWEESRKADKAILIYVHTPLKVCFERVQSRKRTGDKISWEDFSRYEKDLSSVGLEKIKNGADYIIDNTGDLEKLKQLVADLVPKLC
jgi:dephospho-CoA kinase